MPIARSAIVRSCGVLASRAAVRSSASHAAPARFDARGTATTATSAGTLEGSRSQRAAQRSASSSVAASPATSPSAQRTDRLVSAASSSADGVLSSHPRARFFAARRAATYRRKAGRAPSSMSAASTPASVPTTWSTTRRFGSASNIGRTSRRVPGEIAPWRTPAHAFDTSPTRSATPSDRSAPASATSLGRSTTNR